MATFAPKFAVFLLILIVGYLVAKAIAKILSKVLTRVGFDRLVDWSPEDRVAFGKLAEENAWLTVDPGQDEDETLDDIGDLLADDDPAGAPLRAFAADLSTPAALAARALAWHEHIHYGLWRIDDPVPGRAYDASISSPAPSGTSSSLLKQPPDWRDGRCGWAA